MTTTGAHQLLVIDDQQVIHDAFNKIFTDETFAAPGLDDLEATLFGAPTATPNPTVQFQLDHAYQGEEGFNKMLAARNTQRPFAVAFVDMRMPPGWDGLETIDRLLRADDELQVVMCTAYSDYTWNQVIERCGTTDRLLLLKKPFATEEAYQLAIALSEKHRLARAAKQQLSELQTSHAILQAEINQRRQVQEKLSLAATHDGLTGLPNRTCFLQRLAESIRDRDVAGKSLDVVLFLDLDNFKSINDLQGHVFADVLLGQVAERLTAHCRDSDIAQRAGQHLAARLGGDEFVVLLRNLPSLRQGVVVAERLVQALKEPFEIQGQQIVVTISVGIAQVDELSATPEDVLRNADAAMYQAKMSGKDQLAVFDSLMHAAVVRALELESALAVALDNQELRLVYQPIHDVHTRDLVGFEALLRWNRPGLGEVGPAEFIPIAEQSRLMASIGQWVFSEACRQLSEWKRDLPQSQPLRLSVNVSKKQLTRSDFLPNVKGVLDQYPGVAQSLNVEVTESTVMADPELIVEVLSRLREWGVRIHMDDFGTGHSSLSCLHRFPIDVLKIDRSFVMTMESNPDYAAIIHAIISLAHHLKVKVVAEGVENESQLNELRDLGCEYAQGYHFARPLSKSDASDWIAKHPSGTRAIPVAVAESNYAELVSI